MWMLEYLVLMCYSHCIYFRKCCYITFIFSRESYHQRDQNNCFVKESKIINSPPRLAYGIDPLFITL